MAPTEQSPLGEKHGLRGMPSIVKASLQAVPGVARVAVSYKDRTQQYL